METYYHPQDLPKFEEIGEGAPELAKKFFDYYAAVFAEGELTARERLSSPWPWPTLFNVPTVSMPIPRTAWKRAPISTK